MSGRVSPQHVAAAVLALGLVGALAGCGSSGEVSTTKTVTVEKSTSTKASTTIPPRRPAGFTGAFSTRDERQRCKATNTAVVCASTGSSQQVRLDRSGAQYQGEVATSFPSPAPLERRIRTANGTSCIRSSRGIECSRGGHGFVIGDSAVVILRGPNERRYPASTAPPPTTDDALPPPPPGACDRFGTWREAQDLYETDPELYATLDDDYDDIACNELAQAEFEEGFEEAYPEGCTAIFDDSSDGTLYDSSGYGYDETDCAGADPGPGDWEGDVGSEPRDEGSSAGWQAACEETFLTVVADDLQREDEGVYVTQADCELENPY